MSQRIRTANGAETEHVRVAVIGAGFGGLAAAIRLREAGIDDVVVLERADDLGGTWRDNSYPGCACDVPSHLYSFSFRMNPDWTRMFAPQEEILGYLRRCAREHGLDEIIRFGAEVLAARWNAADGHWQLDTSRGPLTAQAIVSASGPLSEPARPDIPGLDRLPARCSIPLSGATITTCAEDGSP